MLEECSLPFDLTGFDDLFFINIDYIWNLNYNAEREGTSVRGFVVGAVVFCVLFVFAFLFFIFA